MQSLPLISTCRELGSPCDFNLLVPDSSDIYGPCGEDCSGGPAGPGAGGLGGGGGAPMGGQPAPASLVTCHTNTIYGNTESTYYIALRPAGKKLG